MRDRWKLLLFVTAVAAAVPVTGQSSTPVSRANWLRTASLGAFMHVLPSDAAMLAQIDDFNVEAVAQQLSQARVKYFVLTLGGSTAGMTACASAVTFDVGPNWNPRDGPIGGIDHAQFEQLRAIGSPER